MMEGVLPHEDPFAGAHALRIALVTQPENTRQARLGRTYELLRGFQMVYRGGNREDRDAIDIRGVVTYRRSNVDMSFASAAAAAASIAADRSWATFEDTGFARSSAMVRRPRRPAAIPLRTY